MNSELKSKILALLSKQDKVSQIWAGEIHAIANAILHLDEFAGDRIHVMWSTDDNPSTSMHSSPQQGDTCIGIYVWKASEHAGEDSPVTILNKSLYSWIKIGGAGVETVAELPAEPTAAELAKVPTVGAVVNALGGKQDSLPGGGADKVLGWDATQQKPAWVDRPEDGATGPEGKSAYQVYVETVPSGQTPMSEAEWLASLRGADGQDGAPGVPGHNPNLGTYLDTDTNKPTTGQAGDYYLVIDTSATPRTANVWAWNGNAFADTQKSVEDFGDQFASGQPVADVHIKDENGEDDPDTQGVLSAEAGERLNGEKVSSLNENSDNIFTICDQYGNVIAKINNGFEITADGHIKIKDGFDSSNITPTDTSNCAKIGDDRSAPFTVSDGNGNVLIKISRGVEVTPDGHIKVLNGFDSADLPDVSIEDGVEVVLPDRINVVAGDVLQIFYKSCVKAVDVNGYNIYVKGEDKTVTVGGINKTVGANVNGKALPRYYQYTPTSDSIGQAFNLTIEVRNNLNEIIAQGSTSLNVIAGATAPLHQKNILVIGASVVTKGLITWELERRLTTNTGNGTPANPTGLNLTNIRFVGRKEVSTTDYTIHQEATGGWGWYNFINVNGERRYRFYIEDGSGDVAVGSTATINGITLTVREKNITNGSGNISCSYSGTLSNDLPSSGTISFSDGSNVNYIRVLLEESNPFCDPNSNQISFDYYVNTYLIPGQMGSSEKIDIVISQLGVNNMAGETWNLSSILNNIKSFVDYFITYNPNGKFIVSTIALPDPTGGMGTNYEAIGNGSNWYTIANRFIEFSQAVEELSKSDTYSGKIFCAPVMQLCDCENMYPKSMLPLNHRASETEPVGSNAFHPIGEGDLLIADGIYGELTYVLSL